MAFRGRRAWLARFAGNAERVSKKKIKPKKGMFGALVARGVD